MGVALTGASTESLAVAFPLSEPSATAVRHRAVSQDVP